MRVVIAFALGSIVAAKCFAMPCSRARCASVHSCESLFLQKSEGLEQPYSLSELSLANQPRDLLEVFDQFSRGVEPDPRISDERMLFAAYIRNRFSHALRMNLDRILEYELPRLFTFGQQPQKFSFSGARVTIAIQHFPVSDSLNKYSSGLVRSAGQAKSNLFEIESNIGFWRKILNIPRSTLAASENSVENEGQREKVIAQIEQMVSKDFRDRLRDTSLTPKKRVTMLVRLLRRLAKKKNLEDETRDFIHASIQNAFGLIGFFDIQILAKLKSSDAGERIKGIQDLAAERDALAIELGFEGHFNEVLERYKTSGGTVLADNAKIDHDVAAFLQELKESRPELKYSSTTTTRQLSLSESPLRSCLAVSDCATSTYFGLAKNKNFVYFTSTDARGYSSGHATLVLGRAGDHSRIAFLDKIQDVEYDRVAFFLESIRQILLKSGYQLALAKRDLGHNGLSNDTGLTQHILNVVELDASPLGPFVMEGFDGGKTDSNLGYSRAKKRLPVFSMRPLQVSLPNSIELGETNTPRRLNLNAPARELLSRTMSLKDGTDEEKTRFLSTTGTLLRTQILSPQEYFDFTAGVFRGNNLKLKYQALVHWFQNYALLQEVWPRSSDHSDNVTIGGMELRGSTFKIVGILTGEELNQLSSQILQRKDAAAIEDEFKLQLLQNRSKGLAQFILGLSWETKLRLIFELRGQPEVRIGLAALRQSVLDTHPPPDGVDAISSDSLYSHEFVGRFLNLDVDTQRKIDLGVWYLGRLDMISVLGYSYVFKFWPKEREKFIEAMTSVIPEFRRKLEQYNHRSCFLAGTTVINSRGSRNIESINIGDLITSFDIISSRISEQSVTEVFQYHNRTVLSLHLQDGRVLNVTPEHPFYLSTERRFRPAGHLFPGDQVLTIDGSMTISEIRSVPGRHTVYNFEVDRNHNYFAEGVLVHNPTKD